MIIPVSESKKVLRFALHSCKIGLEKMTMNDTTVNVRVSKEVKTKAESVLKALNISMSGAIDLYLREIAFHRGLPFAVRIPNETTLKAIHEVEQGTDLQGYSDLDEMFQELGLSQFTK